MLIQLQLYILLLLLLLQSIPEVLVILPSFEWQEFEELLVQFKGLFVLLPPLFLALLIPFQTKHLVMLSFYFFSVFLFSFWAFLRYCLSKAIELSYFAPIDIFYVLLILFTAFEVIRSFWVCFAPIVQLCDFPHAFPEV